MQQQEREGREQTLWMWCPPPESRENVSPVIVVGDSVLREPQPAERRIDWRRVALLSSVQLGADLGDMQETRAHYLEARPHHLPFVEYNPMTKSLLPHPGELYARPVGTAALNAFLSYKLSTNRRAWIRQLRHAPQYVQISCSAQGLDL